MQSSSSTRPRRFAENALRRHRLGASALAAGMVALSLGFAPAPASATKTQLSMFEDDTVTSSPATSIQAMRHLGVGVVRLLVRWEQLAPLSAGTSTPPGNQASPSYYPAANWAPFDSVIRDATAAGLRVMVTVTGGAPAWADGPQDPVNNLGFAWKPNIQEFGDFVQAVGTRYSGHFDGLPAVRSWEIFNEPNFGEDLSPQAIDGSSVLYSPGLYRQIVAVSWNALHRTGHAHDTFVIGALAARGQDGRPSHGAPQGYPGNFGETKPLEFVRALYCLQSNYKPYRGSAATARGCPTTAAASRHFRAQNPGLFAASAFSNHPYPLASGADLPPTKAGSNDRNFSEFADQPRMEAVLDLVQRAYGSGKHFALWNTEYGYVTNPPDKALGGPSPTIAAEYINWAEYLSWHSSRIATTMQYLLADPNPTVGTPEYGGFSSGIEFFGGQPKPGYDAYRLPIWLPSTSTRSGTLEVWGCVRPAHFALLDTHKAQLGYIQFAPRGSGTFKTLQTVSLSKLGASCYFDVHVKFPSSGLVRLAYYYPATDLKLTPPLSTYSDPLEPSVSRAVSITVR